MAYTTIDQLTKNGNGSIVHEKGYYKRDHTFFYAEDVKKVLDQAKGEPSVKLSQLCIIPVKLERSDGMDNHNVHDVMGLALAKSELQRDEDDIITNKEWFPNVAIAWPPYYKKGSVTTLTNDIPGNDFNGHRFEGGNAYHPGHEIHRE